MDWGMAPVELLTSIVVTGRSSTAAKLGLKILEAPEDNPDLLQANGNTPYASTAVTADLPVFVKGSPVGNVLPYWVAAPSCESTGASEEWLDVRVYAGGRKY